MDWTTPLLSLQTDFLKRLKSGKVLHCDLEAHHSELNIISGEKLTKIKQDSRELVRKYKKLELENFFIEKVKEKLGETILEKTLGDLITKINDLEEDNNTKKDKLINFTVSYNSEVTIKVKTTTGDMNTIRWWIDKKEVENTNIIVFIWIKDEIKEEYEKYEVFLAGFLPTEIMNTTHRKESYSASELLYGGGLRSYLENISTKLPDYVSIGQKCFGLGDYQTALDNYNEALQINPKNANIYLRRGRTYYYQGDREAALSDYSEAIKLNPTDSYAYYSRGIILSETGDKKGAIRDYTNAIKFNPTEAHPYYNRGKVLAEIGDYQGAISDYTQAIKINPNDAYAFYNRGKVRYQMGDKEGALADYNNAIQINPKETPQSNLTLETVEFEVATLGIRGKEEKRSIYEAKVLSVNLGENIKLKMIYIPAGKLMMGAPQTEDEYTPKEGPCHEVIISPFFMSKYPITQIQWQIVANFPQVNYPLNPNPSEFKGPRNPVENISWYEAVEFCDRLSQKTGSFYRLPTEAEWEYACRGGSTTPFHFGFTITPEFVNYDGKYMYGLAAKGLYRGQTTPVGSFSPNSFGLYDMHGNVWEWCLDHWHNNYEGAPTDGSAWISANQKPSRVRRGGSWYNKAGSCRSAHRNSCEPEKTYNYLGFRVVKVESEEIFMPNSSQTEQDIL